MLSSIKESTCITGYKFLSFQNCARYEKGLKNDKHNSLHLTRQYPGIFVLGHYLFLNAHSFVELRSRRTVRFSEQIMSADKYPSIFSLQIQAIVYTFSNFQNCACCQKCLNDNKHNRLTLKICLDICPWTLSVPQSSQFSLTCFELRS